MSYIKIISASILGNALEFYNLTLYGVFASLFADLFFPSSNRALSLIASLGTFAAAFLVRPLGAIFFGYIGDRFGRKRALSLSILAMGMPTLIITVLPTYNDIGVFAPIILIACRLVQGLCAGGEFNGATIFALEHLGRKAPGFTGGLIVGSCLLGSMMATGISTIFLMPQFPSWSWRLTFLIGGLFSFFGIYIRRSLSESPVFRQISEQRRLQRTPLKSAVTTYWRSCAMVFSIAAFDGALTYTLVAFLPIYLTTYLEISPTHASLHNFAGLWACMLGCPLFGYYADKFGAKETLVIATLLVLGLSIPTFMALSSHSWWGILGGHISLGLLVASLIGVQPLFSLSLFPPQERYTGISFSYSLGIGFIGGVTPILLTLLMHHTHNFLVPSFYLMSFAVVFLGILLLLRTKR
jgi:MHS family proline/betaine transporter-like MFS transporter